MDTPTKSIINEDVNYYVMERSSRILRAKSVSSNKINVPLDMVV